MQSLFLFTVMLYAIFVGHLSYMLPLLIPVHVLLVATQAEYILSFVCLFFYFSEMQKILQCTKWCNSHCNMKKKTMQQDGTLQCDEHYNGTEHCSGMNSAMALALQWSVTVNGAPSHYGSYHISLQQSYTNGSMVLEHWFFFSSKFMVN